MDKVLITDLNSEGQGVGSLNGLKLFVEGALIGEEVLVSVKEKKKNYATADLKQILTPSSDRNKPPCPYFGRCGGCQIMHLNYKAQLEYKQQKVLYALKKIGGIQKEVSACVPSPQALSYRNKVQLPLIWDKKNKQMGFFKKRSHEIISIERCLIQTELGNQILHTIQKSLELPFIRYVLIKTTTKEDQALLTFVTTEKNAQSLAHYAKMLKDTHPEIQGIIENINQRTDSVILTNQENVVLGESFITETLLNHKFMISSTSFFQVNPKQAERLFTKALELAEITQEQIVVDAYCGVGTLSILAASKAKEVIGIELVKQAITMAKQNAKLNNKKNCHFYTGFAEKLLQRFAKIDVLFINPPRKGCAHTFIEKVQAIRPKTLIYISCNPSTLARDLALLTNYNIEGIFPFDLFPQTTHVETVVKLTVKNKK